MDGAGPVRPWSSTSTRSATTASSSGARWAEKNGETYAIVLDQMPRSAFVLRLARKHGLSAYDALYLELALHKEADLATADRALAAAARAEGVRVVG